MQPFDFIPTDTEDISVEKFLRLKQQGKLNGVHVQGIVPPQLGRPGMGAIRIKRSTPIYKPI